MCNLRKFKAVILFLSVIIITNTYASWETETIDNMGEFSAPSMVLDQMGFAHISYIQNWQLKYATNAPSGQWLKTKLDSDEIWSHAIAIDNIGNIHVCYSVFKENKYLLKYKIKSSSSWSVAETIWENEMGFYGITLLIDYYYNSHISYVEAPGMATTTILKYISNKPDGEWQEYSSREVYDYGTMTIDRYGTPYTINYKHGLYYGTYVWYCSETIGEVAGQLEGMIASIILDNMEQPHLSYVAGDMEDNMYATKINDEWVKVKLDDGDFASAGNSVTVDKSNIAYVSYYNWGTGKLKYARLSSGNLEVKENVDDGGIANDIEVDLIGNVYIAYVSDAKLKLATMKIKSDADRDGISNAEEQGPDGDNPNYDGDGDGIPDSEQNNVASFHTFDEQHYVTFATSNGNLVGIQAIDNPAPWDMPPNIDFPLGHFSFNITGLETGGSTTIKIIVHDGTTIDTYYKYCMLPEEPGYWWNEFMWNEQTQTGAVIEGDVITLHFIDGQRGDSDITANGTIVDPGSPGKDLSTGIISNENQIITGFYLFANYPNPFNAATNIRYRVARPAQVIIKIYNLAGQEVKTIANDHKQPGDFISQWNGRDDFNNLVGSGVYFCKMEVEAKNQHIVQTQKMIYLK